MSTEEKVAKHYTRGRLEETILQAAERMGKDRERLTAEDLSGVDEFHLGGLEATKELAAQMELQPGMHLLDVGSGIGGPARHFAGEHGCKVTGIDLTEEFVQVAESLTRLVKLEHLAEFRPGSVLDLPFTEGTFDRAYMIHVGMNIADKAAVCFQVRRVLKPGGLFVIYDIMRSGEGAIRYPVPWAASDETSFVAEVKVYREALERARFSQVKERGRRAFAIEFIRQTMARVAQQGPPVLGLQLLVGEKTKEMLGNVLSMMQEGIIEPVEMVARVV